jgi:hypothetical protein
VHVPIWNSSTATALNVSDMLNQGAALSGADSVSVSDVSCEIQSVGMAMVNEGGNSVPAGRLARGTAIRPRWYGTGRGCRSGQFRLRHHQRRADDRAAVSVTTDFEVAGVEIDVDAHNPVSLVYDGAEDEFEMYGSVTVSVENPDGDDPSTLTATMGDANDPGLIVSNGMLEQLDFTISADFEIADLDFSADDVGMNYTAGTDNYAFFGSATVSLTDLITASANLGRSRCPG